MTNNINESWSAKIANTGNSSAKAISYGVDGSIVVAGSSDETGEGIYLRKYDQDGLEQWTSTLGTQYGITHQT